MVAVVFGLLAACSAEQATEPTIIRTPLSEVEVQESAADTVNGPSEFTDLESLDLRVGPAFPNLTFKEMVDLTHAPGDAGRLYVVLREGMIHAFEATPGADESVRFLDIRSRVLSRGSEEGLLGLAFAPDYAESGHFYVYYSAPNPRRSVVARFTVDTSTGVVPDGAKGVTILEVLQPYSNHNGGQIAFGPDGYLYVALGDGGGAGDRLGHGQDPQTLLGTILRIDVTDSDGEGGYRIPPDNPFVDGDEGRPEIFAFGLRNPWRFAFDSKTGLLWTADVGQNRYEEIDIVRSGLNYGWNRVEGMHCYPSGGQDCDLAGFEPPVIEYGRSDGCSVTGGRVYRGGRLPSLQGAYVYGDFCSGKIWGLKYDGEAVTDHALLADTDLMISAFGSGPDGELYILDYRERGQIYRFVE